MIRWIIIALLLLGCQKIEVLIQGNTEEATVELHKDRPADVDISLIKGSRSGLLTPKKEVKNEQIEKDTLSDPANHVGPGDGMSE